MISAAWFERSGFDVASAHAAVADAFPDGGVTLAIDGPFLAFVDRDVDAPDMDGDDWVDHDLGRPGPWRLTRDAAGTLVSSFEIPPPMLLQGDASAAAKEGDHAGQGGSRPSSFLFNEALAWAVATRDDAEVDDAGARGVSEPTAEALRAPIAAGGAMASADPGVQRLFHRMHAAMHGRVGPEGHASRDLGTAVGLSPERERWVRRLAAETRRRFQLVRVGTLTRPQGVRPQGAPGGVPGDGALLVRAEVGLGGPAAPPALASGYATAAQFVLDRVARWLGPSLRVVLEPGIASAVLDTQSPRDLPLHPMTQP